MRSIVDFFALKRRIFCAQMQDQCAQTSCNDSTSPFLCLIHEVHTSIIGRKTNDVDCYFNFGVNLILKKKKCYNVIFLKVSWSALLLKLYGFVNLDSKTRDTSKQMTVHVNLRPRTSVQSSSLTSTSQTKYFDLFLQTLLTLDRIYYDGDHFSQTIFTVKICILNDNDNLLLFFFFYFCKNGSAVVLYIELVS